MASDVCAGPDSTKGRPGCDARGCKFSVTHHLKDTPEEYHSTKI